jgi:AcrR family transcriptional regulator
MRRMAAIRLDSEERRKIIVDAARPLFARKGFARTTTKEIAEAACVSEALVFKHFPSKAKLYEEIIRIGCEADPAFEQLDALVPSTAALVELTHFMVGHIVCGVCGSGDKMEGQHRLMASSHLEDGEYARLVFETIMERVYPKFAASLAAAERAGDLVATPVAPENRFWFGHHVAAMVAYVRLPGRDAPYRGAVGAVIDEATWFILRGIGLSDRAIARAFVPGKFAANTL